jgi:hypothetical protein
MKQTPILLLLIAMTLVVHAQDSTATLNTVK